MRCKALARSRRTFAIGMGDARVHQGSDCSNPGLGFLEDRSLLLIIDRRRCGFRIWVSRSMRSSASAIFAFGSATSLSRALVRAVFSAMAETMAFRVSTTFGSCKSGGVLGRTRAHFAPALSDSWFTSPQAFTQQSPADSPPPSGPVSCPCHQPVS